jgi:hypothetical protein
MTVTMVFLYLISLNAGALQPAVVTMGPILIESSIEGRVLAEGSNTSLAGAKVWLINASNDNTTYGAATADKGGYFYFMDVVPLGANAYQLKAAIGNDTGYSPVFGMAMLESKTMDVYVRIKPATVRIEAARDYVVADGQDHIGVTAFAKGSMELPAAGYPITFKARGDTPGSLYGFVIPDHGMTDNEGRAMAEYGWVGMRGAASRVILEASYGTNVTGTLAVDIRSPDTAPPITKLRASGVPDNAGGYVSDVTCTLTTRDPGGWGTNETYYRVGDSGWKRYDGPFTITSTGGTTISYYSTDMAGNAETPKRRTIVVNK